MRVRDTLALPSLEHLQFRFLVCSVSWLFDIDTRLCKALFPHPGEMVYLTDLMFLLFFMIFPAFLLACLSAFLLFYFVTVLLRCAFALISSAASAWLHFAMLCPALLRCTLL